MDSRFEGMVKIYKYPLKMINTQTLTLKGDPLSVINQKEWITVYAPYQEYKTNKYYEFCIIGTGHKFEHYEDYSFLGTVTMDNGNYVFHIFWRKL